MTGQRGRSISIASDDRGRIPFAMIGVLMLVTSSTVVFYLDTRPESEPSGNTAIAMDRASASAQTAVSDGVTEALQKAAAEPVNSTADTAVGNAIDDSDVVIDGPDPMYETFGPYVRLRIYLETQKNLRGTTQRIDNETTSRASLPRISYEEDEIEAAIEKVDLDVGRYHDGMENGTVKATVSGINVSVVRNGTEVANRTETVNVTTGTTAFALHDRTQTYENRLNAGFFDSSLTNLEGFGQRFAARIFPLAWAKAYTERMHPKSKPVPTASSSTKFAFHSIVENYEAETLANDAIFSIQNEVYGATDPRKEQVMRGSWACTGAKTIEKLANARGSSRSSSETSSSSASSASSSSTSASTGSSGSSNRVSLTFDASTVCSATRFLFGGVEGNPPTTIQDFVDQLIGGANSPLDHKQEIPAGMFADPAYQEITDGSMPDLQQYAPANYDSDQLDENASEATNDSKGSDDVNDDYGSDEGEEPSYNFQADTKVQNIIDDTYEVDVGASQSNTRHVSGSIADPDDPGGGHDWDEHDDETTVVGESVTVDHTEVPDTGRQDTLHRIDITLTNTYEETITWKRTWTETVQTQQGEEERQRSEKRDTSTDSTKTYETTIYIRGDYNPSHDVDDNGITNLYTGTDAPAETSNFQPAVNESIDDLISGVSPGNVRGDIEDKFDNNNIEDAGGLESEVDGWLQPDSTIQKSTLLDGRNDQLKDWLLRQLESEHGELKDDVGTIRVSRRRLVAGDNPLADMRDDLNRTNRIYGEDATSPYSTPAHHAKAELVREYVDNTEEWMDKYVQKRNGGRDQINDQLGGASNSVNDALDKTLGFTQDFLSKDLSPNRADVEGSSLLSDDVRYQIDASPTYLSRSPITRATTPEIRPSYAGPETVRDADHAPLAVRNNAWLPVPGLPVVPWPAYWYASANVVGVQVDGEYARFEVTANTSSGPTARSTTYVRQEQPVTVEINQQERTVGQVTPINFTSKTDIPIVTPGATVYPRGSFGPGDRAEFGTVGSHELSECTSAWGDLGADFNLADVDYGDCANLAGVGGNGFSIISHTSDGIDTDTVEDALEDDEDEEEGAVDECDEETLYEALSSESQAENPYDSSDAIPQKIHTIYCKLDEDDQGHYVLFLGSRDELVSTSWENVITNNGDVTTSTVENTIDHLTKDWNETLSGTQSIYSDHELVRFKVGQEIDGIPSEYGPAGDPGAPAHYRWAIVTKIETEEEMQLARVYSPEGYVTGSFLGRPSDVVGADKEMLIEDYALWDKGIVGEEHLGARGQRIWEEERDEGDTLYWGDYECLAKTYVPTGAELYVSQTARFSANNPLWPLNETVDGGAMQFQLIDPDFNPADDEDETWESRDRRWARLGEIDSLLGSNGEEDRDFTGVWQDTQVGGDPATGRCAG